MLEHLDFEYFTDDYFEDLSQSSFSTTDDEVVFSPSECDDFSSFFMDHNSFGKYKKKRKRCGPFHVHQRQAANMRERKRMQSINEAFEGLRTHIPTLPYEKRLSKVDTLRLAIGYISFLAEMVNSTDATDANPYSTSMGKSRKVIIQCHSGILYGQENICGMPPLIGHSLSWKHDKQTSLGPNNTLHAKIWRPADPRALPSDDTGHDVNDIFVETNDELML